MVRKFVKLYVAPDFKKLLKVEAAERGVSLIDLTEELSKGKKVGKRINGLFDKLI